MLDDGVNWSKVIFGQKAMHYAGRIVLQDMGATGTGKHLTVVVGYLVSDGPIISEGARSLDSPHELIVGDMVIRPHEKYSGKEFVGAGVETILTGGALDPENWSRRTE